MESRAKISNRVLIYFSIFFITLSLFTYEIMLTRLFSVILRYNMVFLVVSFSILGSGLGGILAYAKGNKYYVNVHKKNNVKKNRKKKKKNLNYELDNKIVNDITSLKKDKRFCIIGILFSISIFACIMAMYKLPFIKANIVYILGAMIPFVLGGYIISTIFKEFKYSGSKLYFMDLIGSAAGSLIVIRIMNNYGFMYSVVIISIVSSIGALFIWIYLAHKNNIIINSIITLLFAFMVIQGGVIDKIEKNFTSYNTSPNTMLSYLKDSEEKPLGIVYSKWNSISRTDVIETTNQNEKIVITDGGASTPIVKFGGNLDSVKELRNETGYIPFTVGDNKDSLIIGSGGGKDVLFALLGGSTNISAVEINPSTIDAVEKFKEYSGNIYDRPEVKLYVQDGRNFVERTNEKFDNIYLSMVMTNTVENTMYSLSENYIYTYNAFERYLDRLKDNGRVSFMLHDPSDLARTINTGIKVLLDQGIPQSEVTNYFVIVNGVSKEYSEMHGSSIMMPMIIFKKQPFTEDELNKVKNIAGRLDRGFIHFPGAEIGPFKELKEGQVTYKGMLKKYDIDVSPVSDDSPFYYDYSPFLPKDMIAIIVGMLVIWLIIKVAYVRELKVRKVSTHFMAIGIAYMLIEIPIIQKLTLYFGNSSIAFSSVLFSILISSGIGSLISGSKFLKKYSVERPIYLVLLAFSVWAFIFIIKNLTGLSSSFPLGAKFIIAFITILPMGILMGIPFPTGIEVIKDMKSEGNIIPLMWGVNGVFSVIGSVLAVIVSLKIGFTFTIFLGGLIYLLLYLKNPLQLQRE